MDLLAFGSYNAYKQVSSHSLYGLEVRTKNLGPQKKSVFETNSEIFTYNIAL
jgi:hypothetical protein